jgi:hypothetical protein
MRKLLLLTAAVTIAPALLTWSTPGEAMKRPTVDPSDANVAYNLCLVNGGDTNSGSGPGGSCAGAICYCCYDDGCFICNNIGGDCTWDQKARARTIRQRLKGLRDRPARATTIKPDTTTRPPRRLEPGLLEGGGGLSTQGPAATGRPMAPPPPPGQLR